LVKPQHQTQRICLSTDLKERGLGVRYQLKRSEQLYSAFAIRYQQVVYSYINSCAHLGIELDWTPGYLFDQDGRYLICSTHGALFEPESGFCVAGPCIGKSLTPVAVSEKDNAILLLHEERLVTN